MKGLALNLCTVLKIRFTFIPINIKVLTSFLSPHFSAPYVNIRILLISYSCYIFSSNEIIRSFTFISL